MNSIRVLISVTVNKGWPLLQLDVKNAFLHGELQEEVYMKSPSGFQHPMDKGKVCKLKKTLYGLQQSPRAWFERFSGAMREEGIFKARWIILFSSNTSTAVSLPV